MQCPGQAASLFESLTSCNCAFAMQPTQEYLSHSNRFWALDLNSDRIRRASSRFRLSQFMDCLRLRDRLIEFRLDVATRVPYEALSTLPCESVYLWDECAGCPYI